MDGRPNEVMSKMDGTNVLMNNAFALRNEIVRLTIVLPKSQRGMYFGLLVEASALPSLHVPTPHTPVPCCVGLLLLSEQCMDQPRPHPR